MARSRGCEPTNSNEPQRGAGRRKVALSDLRLDFERMQVRVAANAQAVEDYAERYREGLPMPPVLAFETEEGLYLVDGFHRFAAAQRAGVTFLEVEVMEGTLLEAQLHALASNADHGVQRTAADKRRAVRLALEHPTLEDRSDRQIASHCVVSPTLVGQVRREVEEERRAKGEAVPEKRKGADGKQYPTAAVKPSAPSRVVQDEDVPPADDLPPVSVEQESLESAEDEAWEDDAGAEGEDAGEGYEAHQPAEGDDDAGEDVEPDAGEDIEEEPASVRPMASVFESMAAELAEAARKARLRRETGAVFERVAKALDTLRADVEAETPTDCPTCGGAGCVRCKRRGWMTRHEAQVIGGAR